MAVLGYGKVDVEREEESRRQHHFAGAQMSDVAVSQFKQTPQPFTPSLSKLPEFKSKGLKG